MIDFAAMEAEVEAAKARLRKILADGMRDYWEASPTEQAQARLEFCKQMVPAGKTSLKWAEAAHAMTERPEWKATVIADGFSANIRPDGTGRRWGICESGKVVEVDDATWNALKEPSDEQRKIWKQDPPSAREIKP
jgi:hypothetical protein